MLDLERLRIRLRELRKERGLSQAELSKLCKVPQKTISRIESGADVPRLTTLSKIVEVFCRDVEVVFKEK